MSFNEALNDYKNKKQSFANSVAQVLSKNTEAELSNGGRNVILVCNEI